MLDGPLMSEAIDAVAEELAALPERFRFERFHVTVAEGGEGLLVELQHGARSIAVAVNQYADPKRARKRADAAIRRAISRLARELNQLGEAGWSGEIVIGEVRRNISDDGRMIVSVAFFVAFA